MISLVLALPVLAGARAYGQEMVSPASTGPEVDAHAWVLTDALSGAYLEGRNPDIRLPMASTAKIMSALVTLESGVNLDSVVTVSPEAAAFAQPIYSNAGLRAGDRLTVRELLMAALIPSGDDAVYALAEYVGGGDVDRFVSRMNARAGSLGLKNTHFTNPTGLDDPQQYSSAHDLAVMARTALVYPEFRRIVRTVSTTITTQDREIPLHNTNELLLTDPSVTGVKTGTTPGSGPTLVASAADEDEAYIAVVMDAGEDRFTAARSILNYAFTQYEHYTLIRRGTVYATVHPPYRRDTVVQLTAGRDIVRLLSVNVGVDYKVTVQNPLPDSVQKGQQIGEVKVTGDGRNLGSSPLLATEGYTEASVWDKLWYTVQGLWR